MEWTVSMMKWAIIKLKITFDENSELNVDKKKINYNHKS